MNTLAGRKAIVARETPKLGRPTTGNAKVVISFRLPKDLVAWLDAQVGDRTKALTHVIEKAQKNKPH